jgi:tetratricopeptide (TPR) repeat protein
LRLVAATVVPLVLLGALEISLRAVGFGYPTRYFVKVGDSYTSNQRFGWRFFPPSLARTPPVTLIPATKPAGMIRIFVLGGSAAMGTPDQAYGMSRLLDVLLREANPGQRIEVHNLAMTAIGSHVVREIAMECCRLDPDLLVLYLGNNEVVGPYGPGTVFQPVSSSLPLTRLSMDLRTIRIGQLLEALVPGSPAQHGTWKGMEMFAGNEIPADDPRLGLARQHFHRNLADMIEAARRVGAGVVLSTVATNLKDCPPFASVHQDGLTADQLAEWQQLYTQGIELAGSDHQDGAIVAFQEAAELDDRYAELHFRTARCYLDRGDYRQALRSFVAARDHDALRFRADSRINQVIRNLALGSGSGVFLVDGERALANAPETRHGILGDELLFEHVHLRFDGNYLLARAIAETIQKILGERLGLSQTEDWIGRERCAELLALSEWAHYQMAAEIVRMTRRPPFTSQLDHERRLAVRAARLRGLGALAKARADSSLEKHRLAVERDADDLMLRLRLAELLQERHQYTEAVAQWRALIAKVPGVPHWQTQLGFALLDSGKKEQGIAELRQVLELRPQLADTHVNLALALMQDGQLDAAEARLWAALDRDSGFAAARLNLALLMAEQGRLDEAAEQYEQVLQSDPESADARFGLATVRERQGRANEAIAGYRQALAIDPEMTRAGNNLGYLLAGQGHSDEALTLLQQTVRIDPEYALAHFNLADLQLSLGRFREAVASYTSGLSQQPGNTNARINLAVALQVLEQPDRAAEHYREILRQEPEHVRAHTGLAWLLVSAGDPNLRDRAEAVRHADQAARLTGDDAEVLASLATIYENAGELDRANQVRARASALEPGGR